MLTAPTAILYIVLCLTDPTDPVIYEERLKYQEELQHERNENSQDQIIAKISKYNKVDTRDLINSEYVYV